MHACMAGVQYGVLAGMWIIIIMLFMGYVQILMWSYYSGRYNLTITMQYLEMLIIIICILHNLCVCMHACVV